MQSNKSWGMTCVCILFMNISIYLSCNKSVLCSLIPPPLIEWMNVSRTAHPPLKKKKKRNYCMLHTCTIYENLRHAEWPLTICTKRSSWPLTIAAVSRWFDCVDPQLATVTCWRPDSPLLVLGSCNFIIIIIGSKIRKQVFEDVLQKWFDM